MSLAFLVALLEVGHEDNLKGDTMSAMVMLSHTTMTLTSPREIVNFRAVRVA